MIKRAHKVAAATSGVFPLAASNIEPTVILLVVPVDNPGIFWSLPVEEARTLAAKLTEAADELDA